jgi:hypothetical protein
MIFEFEYESDLFEMSPDTPAVAPLFAIVKAKETGLPLGTYFDTLIVKAGKAINSPKQVIIQYNVIPGSLTPQVHLTKFTYYFPAQENGGPIASSTLAIYNRFGGCMPWTITESAPWLEVGTDSGDVPGSTDLVASAAGYTLGEYEDSLFIVAPGASNSPKKVRLFLQVWRFHGDWDWDGGINVHDLVINVNYLFFSGPGPLPEQIVGDMNCDRLINIADLTYFVEYLFADGDIPCGNPFK